MRLSSRMTTPRLIRLAGAVLALALPAAALAQPGGAQSTFIDPSIASAGMGRTGVAVFWGDDPNDWSNPSLLGYHRGIRYSYGRTQLVPDLADDIFFTSHRFTIGACGIGLSLAGKPIEGLGKFLLDYGESEATDEEGNVIGVFSSFEEVRQFGVGISLFRALESLSGAFGGHGLDISRHVDLSIGHAWKNIVVDLGTTLFTGFDGHDETTEKDRGVLLRVTPLGAAPREGDRSASMPRLDASVGFSQRNYGDNSISFYSGSLNPIVEERLLGAASRLSIPVHLTGSAGELLAPEISLGAAWEEARYYDAGERLGGIAITRTGQEVTLLGILSLRHGFIDDESGAIQDHTWGIGVGLQYRGIGARYDWARVPQSSFLDDVTRQGFSVVIDPYRIWQGQAGRDGAVASR
jgi:hypothetical protein